ncbi:MAG: ribosome hibernation-promoting factor, HPF/YfiA family [Hyphomicrobiaceae bacterium]
MTIQITGKNIEVGNAFQTYVVDKARAVLEKYIGPEIYGHVRTSKERGRFHTNCSIRLRTGLLLEASGEGEDAYVSADAALQRLEKRVRRYKRRLKSHHTDGRSAVYSQYPLNDYVVEVPQEDVETGESHDGSLVIAETERMIREMVVRDAVMQLDLTEEAFLVFRNAANGATNIVYRRQDGNVGWINPAAGADE